MVGIQLALSMVTMKVNTALTYIVNTQLKCLGFWRQWRSLVSLDKVNCLATSSGHVIRHCVSCAPRIDDRVECLHVMSYIYTRSKTDITTRIDK